MSSKNELADAVLKRRTARRRDASGLVMLALCYALAACDASHSGNAQGPVAAAGEWGDARPQAKTIGLAQSGYNRLFYETADGKEECPHGLAYSSRDNWEAQFPTKEARRAHLEKCSLVDNRGPDCASVYSAPDLIKDPLPFREIESPKAHGLNLDGTEDGRETASTCAHRKFTGFDGTKGVDNQYYRLYGCHRGMRGRNSGDGKLSGRTTLLEIRGVDDERNDDSVEVAVYRSKSSLIVDAERTAMPWQAQTVDDSDPPWRLRGRIVDGMLITEPADPPREYGRNFDVRYQLRLTETGAEGIQAGYADINQLWNGRKGAATASLGDSLPSIYAALHRLADGRKDPKTGLCTGLSTATGMKFVRVHIRHPDKRT